MWILGLKGLTIFSGKSGCLFGVAETSVGSLLRCGVGIVWCLFKVIILVIATVCNTKKRPEK